MKRKQPAQQLDLPLRAQRGGALLEVPTPLSRATARRSARHVEAPAPLPWHCTVLAVDTARRSGWALYALGVCDDSGELDTLDEATVEQIVTNAVELAASHGVPCVLVLEAPFGGSVDVVAALGVARERWLRAWRRALQSPGRVVRVQPSSWRAPVLGGEWASAPRDEVRAHEMRTARALLVRARGRAPLLGHDEAAAVLIGRWASHAAAVGRANRQARGEALAACVDGGVVMSGVPLNVAFVARALSSLSLREFMLVERAYAEQPGEFARLIRSAGGGALAPSQCASLLVRLARSALEVDT